MGSIRLGVIPCRHRPHNNLSTWVSSIRPHSRSTYKSRDDPFFFFRLPPHPSPRAVCLAWKRINFPFQHHLLSCLPFLLGIHSFVGILSIPHVPLPAIIVFNTLRHASPQGFLHRRLRARCRRGPPPSGLRLLQATGYPAAG